MVEDHSRGRGAIICGDDTGANIGVALAMAAMASLSPMRPLLRAYELVQRPERRTIIAAPVVPEPLTKRQRRRARGKAKRNG